jgi:hypothetical protein
MGEAIVKAALQKHSLAGRRKTPLATSSFILFSHTLLPLVVKLQYCHNFVIELERLRCNTKGELSSSGHQILPVWFEFSRRFSGISDRQPRRYASSLILLPRAFIRPDQNLSHHLIHTQP